MISLKDLNAAVCTLYQQALDTAGTGARLVAEDLSCPIIRPSGKVVLDDSTDARLLHPARERQVTFRLYYFAAEKDRPKLENLLVRDAIGCTFLDGLTVGDTWIGIDDGVQFSVADGVLVAAITVTLAEELPEPEDDWMEELDYQTEVEKDGSDIAEDYHHV